MDSNFVLTLIKTLYFVKMLLTSISIYLKSTQILQNLTSEQKLSMKLTLCIRKQFVVTNSTIKTFTKEKS